VNYVPLVFSSWSESTVSLFANWGSISFLVFMVPILYLQDYSLRLAIVLSSSLIALGTTIRCAHLVFPGLTDGQFTVLAHVAAILNGIPGIVVTSAPPAVSAAWFPAHERVTATSISQMLNNIGQGLSFLIANLLVKEPKGNPTSSLDISGCAASSNTSSQFNISHAEEGRLKQELDTYMLVLAGPAIILFIFCVLYFPSKPPHPPSHSATEARLDFRSGCMELVRNPASWLLALVWSIPQAVWNNWCAMMVVSLTKVGQGGECLSEQWVNMLGLVAVLVGTMVAIMVGMVTDRIKGKMKVTIVSLLVLGGLLFTTLSLISLQVIRFPNMVTLKVFVYVFLLLGNSCVVSTSPLLMEFGVEKLYPINEGMIGGWLNIWYNIISVIFLGIFSIPGIGNTWLNFVLPLSCFMVLPLFLTVKEEYKRSVLDEDTPDAFCHDDEESEEEADSNHNTDYGQDRIPVFFTE